MGILYRRARVEVFLGFPLGVGVRMRCIDLRLFSRMGEMFLDGSVVVVEVGAFFASVFRGALGGW